MTEEPTEPKWRGIKTTQEKKNETFAKTIINRLGQKSISLPRIDDKKRWAGFPGLSGWAAKLATFIPPCKYYVEPFAGAAKVYQELIKIKNNKVTNYVLNDKSPFIYEWLQREFTGCIITNADFAKCITIWDSTKTVFLLDLPWFRTFYDQEFSLFDRKSVRDYDKEIIELCKKMKGKFIITSRKENDVFLKAKFYHKLIKSIYPVSGHLPRLLLTSNFPLKRLRK